MVGLGLHEHGVFLCCVPFMGGPSCAMGNEWNYMFDSAVTQRLCFSSNVGLKMIKVATEETNFPCKLCRQLPGASKAIEQRYVRP